MEYVNYGDAWAVRDLEKRTLASLLCWSGHTQGVKSLSRVMTMEMDWKEDSLDVWSVTVLSVLEIENTKEW